MKLLLLDTCGAEGSLALADTDLGEQVFLELRMPGRTASERLVSAVREAMNSSNWKLRECDAIVVVTGPGSFTGVRVGLSVAKGLSEASGVPLVAVSRLAMLAAEGTGSGTVGALLDAGRGEFYYGRFGRSSEARETLSSKEDVVEGAVSMDEIIVCEEIVAKSFEGLEKVRLVPEPAAAQALPLALRRIASGDFDDPMTLDANYLRRSDAEIFAPKPVA